MCVRPILTMSFHASAFAVMASRIARAARPARRAAGTQGVSAWPGILPRLVASVAADRLEVEGGGHQRLRVGIPWALEDLGGRSPHHHPPSPPPAPPPPQASTPPP